MHGDTIELFMWGFQSSFRFNVERAVEHTLEELGVAGEPTVLLVGVLAPGGSRHPICIEPEDGSVVPADFSDFDARAAALYQQDPDSRMIRSDPRHHTLMQQRNRHRAAAAAIAEILERKDGEELRFFVGMPTLVEEHFVYPAIGVPRQLVAQTPRLTATEIPEAPWLGVTPSLLEGAILALLRSCSRALLGPDPGDGLGIGVEPADTTRAGARSLLDTVVALAGNEYRPSFLDGLNRVSTTRYEQRLGLGRFIVAAADSQFTETAMVLRRPLRIGETRAVRKLLEASRVRGEGLLTDGAAVYGLGHIRDDYEPGSESVFEVLVVGHGSWELQHSGHILMAVENGAARVGAPPLQRQRFDEITSRVFARGGCDTDALWALAEAARLAEHGTMLVVSERASEEAERLQGQAMAVTPVPLEPSVVEQVTAIDGALLVDPHGTCHAFGVILDGTAVESGDRSRGARYNSAVRYLASASAATMIMLVSEDGMINLLPDLRPRMSRAALEGMMSDLRAAAALEPVHPERFYKAYNRVKAASFYLNSELCKEANRLVAEHWERRRAAGAQLWTTEPDLVPDSEMSDEYLSD